MLKTKFHATDDQYVFERTQDITDIVEQNKALYNATDERERWGEWTRYAQLPFAVVDDLNKRGSCEALRSQTKKSSGRG